MADSRIFLLTMLLSASSAVAAERLRKLHGEEIGAKLVGMQFTDGVNWRDVYEQGGVIRSFDTERAVVGTWHLRNNDLCVDSGSQGDTNCFEVWMRGSQIVMQRDNEDPQPREGFLEKVTESGPIVCKAKP
jgi:hypothetical protein